MKKIIAIGFVFLFSIGLLSGCGSSYDADSSTVFILKKGKVAATDVENFDEEEFSKSELEDYVKNEIQEYASENGKNSIKLKTLSVQENQASLTLTYGSAEDYSNFTGIELYSGSIIDALAEGYSFDVSFRRAEDGEEVSVSEVLDNEKLNLVVIKANTTVVVPGDIVFYSAQNTVLVDSKTLAIGQETGESDTGTEEGSEPEENEPEEAVESTEDAGSISDDEMLTGEESTEMHFDFDETEADTVQSEYSDFYTYIIYK